jgi:iron complex outermembrane receptor protein
MSILKTGLASMSTSTLALSALLVTAAPDALAQGLLEARADDTEEIFVISTRRNQLLEEIPRSVLVLDEESLTPLITQTTSVQEILGKIIPGFAPPVTEGSAGSLTLRGRAPLYLLDGIPIASNTNFSRFLDKFDPLTIGRVEVVYGPTALYGAGATGGVIQFFTQNPNTEELEVSAGTQIRGFAVPGAFLESDGISTKVNGSISGPINDIFSVYGFVSYEDVNGLYRSEGDLLTGRSQFQRDLTFQGKLRADISDTQAFNLTFNRTTLRPSDRQFELARIDAGDGTIIAGEAPITFTYAQPPTNDFLFISGSYTHDDLFGGSLSALVYYTESEFLNPGSDVRPFVARNGGPFPDEWPGLWQTGRQTDELGFRGQYNRDFYDRINVVLGIDYNAADSVSLLPISTEEGFDDTAFYDAAQQGTQTPPFTLDAIGLFVEASVDVTDRFSISGGMRWDQFDYTVVGPYEVTFFFPAFFAGERPGGSGKSDGLSFNIGARFEVLDDTILFANYSQGFSIPELGFIGNNVAPGVPVSDSDLVAPLTTDSFEGGLRGQYGPVRYSFAGYYTESNFPTSVGVDPLTGLINRDRVPVKIWGIEASANWDVTSTFSLETFLSWTQGEIDPQDDGKFIAISTQDVPPIRMSARPNWQATQRFNVFGQIFYSGDRSAGFDAGTDANPAESYALIDIGAVYNFEFGGAGAGDLSLQVTNLFNKEYIPPGEVSFIPGRIFSGQGRAITLSYQHRF